MILLKLMYESPRPFWLKSEIQSFGKVCSFDFASPSQHVFNVMFFWVYVILMYFQKYSLQVNKPLIITLYSILGVLFLLSIFGMYMGGEIYIYHVMISCIYSCIFLLITLNFDAEILNKCEQIGFIVRSSRRYKFYLLFFSIGLYVVGLILLESNQD